jgi:hypothetical protein
MRPLSCPQRHLPRFVFALLLPSLALLAVAPTAPAASGTAPRDCSVTLEGDSIMSGIHTPDTRLPESPAALLRRMRPAYTVTDNSASGSTAFARAPEFAKTPVTTRFVVLEHGINDAQFGKPYEPALRGMVAHVKAAGRIPLITGLSRQPLPSRGRDAHDQTARRVAADTGSLFVDWGAVAFKPREMADVLHPGPAYSARLMARLVAVLDMAAPECRR